MSLSYKQEIVVTWSIRSKQELHICVEMKKVSKKISNEKTQMDGNTEESYGFAIDCRPQLKHSFSAPLGRQLSSDSLVPYVEEDETVPGRQEVATVNLACRRETSKEEDLWKANLDSNDGDCDVGYGRSLHKKSSETEASMTSEITCASSNVKDIEELERNVEFSDSFNSLIRKKRRTIRGNKRKRVAQKRSCIKDKFGRGFIQGRLIFRNPT